jgi:hypothetical protein
MRAHGAGRKLTGSTKRGAEMESAFLRSPKTLHCIWKGATTHEFIASDAPIALVCDTHSVTRVLKVTRKEDAAQFLFIRWLEGSFWEG